MTTRAFTISNSDPNPNGTAAKVYKNPANGPNQATWKALDRQYTVTLPSTVWTPPAGGSLTFTIDRQQTSGVYTVKSDAPTGTSGYTIDPPSRERVPPEIMVEP